MKQFHRENFQYICYQSNNLDSFSIYASLNSTTLSTYIFHGNTTFSPPSDNILQMQLMTFKQHTHQLS